MHTIAYLSPFVKMPQQTGSVAPLLHLRAPLAFGAFSSSEPQGGGEEGRFQGSRVFGAELEPPARRARKLSNGVGTAGSSKFTGWEGRLPRVTGSGRIRWWNEGSCVIQVPQDPPPTLSGIAPVFGPLSLACVPWRDMSPPYLASSSLLALLFLSFLFLQGKSPVSRGPSLSLSR